MRNYQQFNFQFGPELIVDLFAGGGGASLGIEQAFRRPVDICVNHDAEAVQMHMANHPRTQHYCADVFEVDPIEATKGRAVGLLWASPSCTHFSKAKGGKPVDKKIRGLSWVVVDWAKAVRPRVIMLENVEEFQSWGPLTEDSKPYGVGQMKEIPMLFSKPMILALLDGRKTQTRRMKFIEFERVK